MALCISDILWANAEDETAGSTYPELEVTDGWYRLRARIDAPIARAVKRGIIRPGRKICVAGTRVRMTHCISLAPLTKILARLGPQRAARNLRRL